MFHFTRVQGPVRFASSGVRGLVLGLLLGCSQGALMTSPSESSITNYSVFSAERKFVETEFGSVAVVEKGSGPVAVFLHGFPLNGFHWRHQLVELSDIRRCVALDLMGLGHTVIQPDQELSFAAQAAMVLATLDAMGIVEFDLVGNDTGGGIAQIVAAKAPQRVRSLVLTNADTHDNYPPEFGVVHKAAAGGILAGEFVKYLADPALAKAGLASLVFEDPNYLTPELVEIYLGPLVATPERRANVHRYMTSQDNAESVAIQPDLAGLEAPTLVLWASADPFFGIEWAYWLRDTIPGVVQVTEFPGAKLFFTEERASEVTKLIRLHWTRELHGQ